MYQDDYGLVPKGKLSVKKAKKQNILSARKEQKTDPLSKKALIASVYGGLASLIFEGRVYECVASAAIMTDLVVGDKVSFDLEQTPWRITSILPRRTELKRMRGEGGSRHRKQLQIIAANVDAAVIVATAAEPDFEPELVDRYLILCRASKIELIICLNKSELTSARHPALALYREQGILVIETSTKTGLGIEELRQALRGKTAILLGKSGAGKSSLTNALDPKAEVKTQEINARAQQGQHTTTRSDIHVWEPGSFLIDTPGIRTLDVSHVDDDDIALGFPDIMELAHECRFSDCRHEKEPGCAVKRALEEKQLPQWRWESFTKINSHDVS